MFERVNSEVGANNEISIRINALEQGSFVVDLAIVALSQSGQLFNKDAASLASDLVGIVGGLYGLHQVHTESDEVKTTNVDNGMVRIEGDNNHTVVHQTTNNFYQNDRSVRESMASQFASLEEDSSVEGLDFLDETEQIFSADKDEFPKMAQAESLEDETKETTKDNVEVVINRLLLDGSQNRRWEFYYQGNKISANITDEDFLEGVVANNMRFGNGDRLTVDLQVTQVYDDGLGIFVNDSHTITEVHDHQQRPTTNELDFGES